MKNIRVGIIGATGYTALEVARLLQGHENASVVAATSRAHAGEALGPESVIETLDKIKPLRIGHGVRSVEDSSLLNKLKNNSIHLELCFTSNIVTKVYDNYMDHPIDILFKKGLSISVNSDGRTISDTDLNQEYEKDHKVFFFSHPSLFDRDFTSWS